MQAFTHDFVRDRLIRTLFMTSLAVHIFVWILVFMGKKPDSALPVVLHYSVFQGVDILGPMGKFYLLLVGGTLILAVNFLLARVLYRPFRVASYILGAATVMAQLMILLTFVTFRLVNY